jgi:phosphate transporter
LKKYIYHLEKRQVAHRQNYRDADATESSALIAHADGEGSAPSAEDTDAFFRPLIDREIKKVEAFYLKQEQQLVQDVAELEALVHDEEERGRGDAHWVDDEEHDDGDEDEEEEGNDAVGELQSPTVPSTSGKRRISRSPIHLRRQISQDTADSEMEDSLASLPPLSTAQLAGGSGRRRDSFSGSPISPVARGSQVRQSITGRLRDSVMSSLFDSYDAGHMRESTWTANTHYAQDTRLLFKRKITNLYISVTNLKSYAEVNQSGFRKILKK